ncbi:unnamed protein product [Prorocentrum cordatum]|uniref:Protein phosphatase 1 regulatory subunit 21 C-terminal domain-containing protein n=1 Tax=Prorocentrum cordatum TaxID=2364126 RepID=A0ABN9Q7D4_9DINO|nr:unnamed protein product [Polarella glacialis]
MFLIMFLFVHFLFFSYEVVGQPAIYILFILCSQVMQDAGGRSAPGGSGAPTSATEKPGGAGSLGELVLSSRQRALLDSVSVTAQESASLRQHGFFVDVISLSAGEASLASGPPSSEALESWELAVRKVYEQHVRSLQAQVRSADGKATELHLSMQHNLGLLKEQEEAKQTLRDQVSSKHEQLNGVLEDMATTRKNYDSQLAVLTEHICGLSQKISEKDESLASLQTQKVLCGHCGTWSVMGKLLSPEAAGVCQTCKEKVLSKV